MDKVSTCHAPHRKDMSSIRGVPMQSLGRPERSGDGKRKAICTACRLARVHTSRPWWVSAISLLGLNAVSVTDRRLKGVVAASGLRERR